MKNFSFDISGSKYEVSVKSIDGDIANLEVNGTPYSVQIHREEAAKASTIVRKPASEPAKTAGTAPQVTKPTAPKSSGAKTVKSPLPGNVIKVNVAVGDSFKDGDTLMVLESMKMENNVLAETNGKIVGVKIKAGDAVLQDDVLFEIE